MPQIKAITLHQPWASLIAAAGTGHEVYQGKRFETRSWRTNYHGPLAIHAAKTKKSLAFALEYPANAVLAECLGYKTLDDLPRGKVVAVADLAGYVSTNVRSFIEGLPKEERAFGNYGPDRWAWKLENIRPLSEPVPVRGHQGLWDISRDLITPKEANA